MPTLGLDRNPGKPVPYKFQRKGQEKRGNPFPPTSPQLGLLDDGHVKPHSSSARDVRPGVGCDHICGPRLTSPEYPQGFTKIQGNSPVSCQVIGSPQRNYSQGGGVVHQGRQDGMHRAVPSTDDQAVASLTQDLLGDGQRFLRIAGQKAIRRRAKVLDMGQEAGEELFPFSAPGGRVDDNLDFHLLPGKNVE